MAQGSAVFLSGYDMKDGSEGSNGGAALGSGLKIGDAFSFQAGDVISADAEVIVADQVKIDEFDLTGELVPAVKAVGDRLLAGALVVEGKGCGKATAVGADTEYGRIATSAKIVSGRQEESWRKGSCDALFQTSGIQGLIVFTYFRMQETPFCTDSLFLLGFLLMGIFALDWIKIWRKGMESWLRCFIKRSGFSVLDPSSLETLGEITACCFDKTGVLTIRRMAVGAVLSSGLVEGRRDALPKTSALFHRIAIGCAFCHQLRKGSCTGKSPLDEALFEFAQIYAPNEVSAAKNRDKRIEIPFAPENRFSVVSGRLRGETFSWIKGAPEVILQRCRSFALESGGETAITAEFLLETVRLWKEQFAQGKTVVALAEKAIVDKAVELTGYCFLGLIVLENPMRDEAAEVIRNLAKQKIQPVILTGDIPAAALFAGKRLGIAEGEDSVLTGPMLEKMSLGDATEQSRYVRLFARLTPSQKGLVVEAFKRQGRRVLMIGDGANDAIALKLADIGLSFTKESSVQARKNSNILIHEDLWAIPRLLTLGRRYRFWNRWMPLPHRAALAAVVCLQILQLWPGLALELLAQVVFVWLCLASLALAEAGCACWIVKFKNYA